MKKQIIVSALATIVLVATNRVSAGPAFDSLVSAANLNGAALPVVFDGVARNTGSEVTPVFSAGAALSMARSGSPRQNFPPVPVPGRPSPVNLDGNNEKSRLTLDYAINEKTERPIINKGLAALKAVSLGTNLYNFFESEKVEIRWKPLPQFDKSPLYARACPPEECGDKKVIYLNDSAKDKDLFYSSNPTFLTIVLAHELTHLKDYKDIGNGVAEKNSVNLFLELNGWSAETYVYHQLLEAGIAPEPGSPDDNAAIQLTRLNLSIRDYLNGGKEPNLSDYMALLKSGRDMKEYYEKATLNKNSGIMALSGVVEHIYDIDSVFENMADPGLVSSLKKKKQYKQYKKLRESLGLSTAEYIKWRKANVDPAPPSSSSGVVAPSVSSGSGSNNGSNSHPNHQSNNNGNDNDEPNSSGSNGGEWHPSTDPHPGFNPDGTPHL